MPLSRQKIAARREGLKLTMEEAGRRYGFSARPRQQWYALETGVKGDPRLATIEGICRVLGCSIIDLLDDDSPAMPPRPGRRRADQNRRTPSDSAGSNG